MSRLAAARRAAADRPAWGCAVSSSVSAPETMSCEEPVDLVAAQLGDRAALRRRGAAVGLAEAC